MKRAFIMVLDSFGIGATEDADRFGDVGADTLGHIAEACAKGEADHGRKGPLNLPNLTRLGLVKAHEGSTGKIAAGMDGNAEVIGAYAWAHELSSGKDTPSGHWEIAGVPVLFDWGYFSDQENSFPQELLDKLVKRANLPGYLGNCHSSGTVILDQLGEEHMKTGKPIFYTSADSVFQIACHEETFGLDKLYELCEIAREELTEGGYNIGRVIARPFVGDKAGNFQRTGTYKGRKISVMGHGMGIPSCSIYTKELITDFGVKKIIRVGSCGAVREDVKLRDVVIGMGACTDSKVNRLRFKDHDFAAIADFGMVRNAVDAAKALGVDARVGNIFSADLFYTPDPSMFDVMEKYGILGVEMEAAGIYGVAAEFGAKALTICTVSDHIRTHEQTTAAERQTTFNDMIKIALESVLLGDKE
ncbi:TPA: phosphopentomutase [Klebsiella pneumoniae]|nr:phosphopentomutase [Klebsiella pneumoniae]